MATAKELRKINIMGVAESLGVKLKHKSSHFYEWEEHDSFIIDTHKNKFYWYARGIDGDPLAMVQVVREELTGQSVSFKEAKHYLETGEFSTVNPVAYTHKEFSNYLAPYESKDKSLLYHYLMEERKLSEETIRFFDEKGVLAQANYKTGNTIEPVIIFKYLDAKGKMIGGSLQGIIENRELHDRGRLKSIMKHSDGISGFNIDIGSPKRLIVAEAPIDLMSYYELHKSELNDVRLVAMDGLKSGIVSRQYMEILALNRGKEYEIDYKITPKALFSLAQTTTHFQKEENQSVITLAVDNDSAGRKFLSRLEDKGIRFVADLPRLESGQKKSDWNDILQKKKEVKTMEKSKARGELDIAFHSSEEPLLSQYSQSLEIESQSYVVPKQKERSPDEERIVTYSELRRENEELVKRLENQIKVGDLAINFDTDVYLYDVFAKLGNSHPFKYINDKRLEVLSPIQPILASIDDKTVDLYKNKGTIEQDSLYQALKSHQRTLGVDVSTRFIGELAIAAYSTNKQLASLSSESFGSYYGNRTLDNLSHSIERILEYSLIETEARDFEYGFMTIPNAIYHYLEEQEGEVSLDRATLDTLISRIKDQPFQIVEENQKDVTISKATEKALEQAQEQIKNAEGTIGDFPDNQEAAPLPEANVSQPLNDLSPSQTQPQPLLHFTTKEGEKSIDKRFYHVASQKEIAKLNRYALTIQQTAQWYLDKVADSRIIYLYQDGDSISSLAVQFDRDKFMHLTGIFPYQEGQTAEQTLLDFANGKGDFDSILLADKGATFDKVKVLPELEAIVESDSFYFGDLSEVPKLKRLDLDKAIRSGDEDILLAMRTVDGTTFPASLMKLRQSLKLQLDSTNQERSILGVYRYRDNQLDQLSINEELIKDGGESFESILDQVVENLNQADQTDKTVDKDMVYQDQPLVQDQLEEQGKTEVGFQPSTYRLEQAKNKLIRLETELNQAVQDIFDHQKLTNGQPMNDKKGSQSWYRREAQLDGRASDLRQQIEDQKNYIEHLERQMEWLSRGYDRKGQGLRLTIDNIPNIEREIELAKAGQGNFSQATIRKYQKELERLKASQGILEKIHLSPEARALIDEGILNQWKKQPFIYFVKGLDKVALELTETGVFRASQKYAPQTVEAKKQISELLEQLNSKEQVVETSGPVQVEEVQDQLEPDKKKEAKAEPVGSTSYTQSSNQNKLSELLASKDRAGLTQHLKEGVHQYLNSEQYKDFLNTMSRFPNYSYRNIQLLKAQMPTVQVVASFKSWKEDFGRTVIKGSKSLRIFAPQITKLRDPQTGEVLKDEQGNDKTRVTFKLVPVFDISQTEGKELPKPIYQLEGNHENYSKLYRSAKEYAQSKGLIMEFNSNIGEANGYYSRKENKIVIKAGMSEQQTLKTIYHELAHADLHSSKNTDKELKYSHAELQAESVAYVVANHYGFDTSEYSFGYLATWVRDKEALSDLEAQLEIVQKEAQQLIRSLDAELEKQLSHSLEHSQEKQGSVEKLSFEERLNRAQRQAELLETQQEKEVEQIKKDQAKQSI